MTNNVQQKTVLEWQRIGGNAWSKKEEGMFARIVSAAGLPELHEIAIVYYKPHHEIAENYCKMFTAAPLLLEAAEKAVDTMQWALKQKNPKAGSIDPCVMACRDLSDNFSLLAQAIAQVKGGTNAE